MRWGRGVLLAFSVLLATAAATVEIAASDLARPWIKDRVRALALSAAGLDIDYAAASLHFLSGFEADGIVVHTPGAMRAFAPDLVRVGRVRAAWTPSSLVGRGPHLRDLAVSDVTLTVVVDEAGRSSFDAIGGSNPKPAPPSAPVPISRQAEKALAGAPPFGHIEVARVAVVLIRVAQGKVAERDSIDGLGLDVAAAPDGHGWRIHAEAGTPSGPLELDVERALDGSDAKAKLALWLGADASARAVDVRAGLRVPEQGFIANVASDPKLAGAPWLQVDAHAAFKPDAQRTVVTLTRLEAAGGAATVHGAAELPDQGDPVVDHAEGDVDLARLLAWAPPGLLPVAAERATARFRIDAFAAGHFAEHGGLSVDVDLANATAKTPSASVAIDRASLAVHAKPAPGERIAVDGALRLGAASIESRGDVTSARDVAVDLDGRQAGDGSLAGRVSVQVAQASQGPRSRPPSTEVRDAGCEVKVDGLFVDTAAPFATRGDVSVAANVRSSSVRSASNRIDVEGAGLRAHARLEGKAPYAVDVDLPVARLRVAATPYRVLIDGPAHAEVKAHDLVPDLIHPEASRGAVHAALDLGEAHVVIDASKAGDAVDYTLSARAASLRSVRPFLPPHLAESAPWDAMGVDLRSHGRASAIAGPSPDLDETTEVTVDHPGFGGASAQSVAVSLRSSGTASVGQARVDLRARSLVVADSAPSDDHVDADVAFDRSKPSVQLDIATDGRVAAKVTASASFDRARKGVAYDFDAKVGGLAPLASQLPALAGLELTKLAVELAARGEVVGVVTDVGRDGAPVLARDPLRTAGVEGTVDLRATGIHFAQGVQAIDAPAVAWHVATHAAEGRRTVDNHLEVSAMRLAIGQHVVNLTGLTDDLSAVLTGDLADPATDVTEHLTLRSVDQDFAPEYPVGDVDLSFTGWRDAASLMRITDFSFRNGAGGTTLGLVGGADLGPGRHRLSMTANLKQDLAHVSTSPAHFEGRGTLELAAKIESPDLAVFRAEVDLKADDVHAHVPKEGISVDAVTGHVPIAVAFEVGKGGVTMRHDAKVNPYSSQRFADQHPLLSNSGYISIGQIKTPWVSIAPLVGNLGVEQNVVTLRQFEMGVRNGRITGECALDWEGARSTAEMHVRATGVESSHGEPFDGNIAVAVSASDRTIEGRAEILRIGPRHLLDLLDLEDPLHVDPAMNRIRTALSFGYPDKVRLVFDHGFASARLQLGGLARLISISEVHGIPIGPIVDRFLNSPVDAPEAP